MPTRTPTFYLIAVASIILICVFLLMILTMFTPTPMQEGLINYLPAKYTDDAHTKLSHGYFLVDNSNMAVIPYGYEIDQTNFKNIIPITKTAIADLELKTKNAPSYVPNGQLLPSGYYVSNIASNKLSALPPLMMPNVASVSFTTASSISSIPNITYNVGYKSEVEYYNVAFPVENGNIINIPESTVYFVDTSHTFVAFLPPNAVAKTGNGYVYPNAPADFSVSSKQYDNIRGNIDITFHEDPTEIAKRDSLSSINMNNMIVRNASGNLVILNFPRAQGLPTYYEPGAFLFSPTTYVPNYEDAIYLSKTTNESTAAKYTMSTAPTGKCAQYSDSPIQLEKYCQSVPADTCASTDCCVLLGGSKCVSGSQSGPTYSQNYSDLRLENKDKYYYRGNCYGNCPTPNLFILPSK